MSLLNPPLQLAAMRKSIPSPRFSRPDFVGRQPTKLELVINLIDRQDAAAHCVAGAARPRRRGDRITLSLLRCTSTLLAQSGHTEMSAICPLSGAKQPSAADRLEIAIYEVPA